VSVRHTIPKDRLPSSWTTVTLREVTNKIGSGATPRGGESAYVRFRDKFALIRSQNVFDHRFETAGLAFISDKQAAELTNAQVRSGDVLLNITGDGVTFARACLVPDGILPACVNQHVSIVRANPSLVDPGYLVAYLAHPSTKSYIESFNAGGSRRAITKGHIESFQLPLPPLIEQKQIGVILGTINRKIELNLRMNETLEAIVRAMFKLWFVDSDIVPKEAGSVDRFSSIATIGRESVNPPKCPTESFDHYSIPAFDEGRLPTVQTGAQIKSNKFVVRDNSVLLSKLNPRIPRVWMPLLSVGRRAICSTEFLVLQPRDAVSREYLYGLCTSQSFLEVFATMVTGTSGSHQRVKPEYLDQMLVTVPSEPRSKKYANLVRPVHAKAAHNLQESFMLAALRDTLLPKLMSGEIRLKDAEKIAAPA
jgi:type I restriction enzyme S subunit